MLTGKTNILWSDVAGGSSANQPRSEVDPQETWDLTPLFADDEAWEKAFDEAQSFVKKVAPYKDVMLSSADKLLEFIELNNQHIRKFSQIFVYAHLKNDQDTGNSTYSGMSSRAIQLISVYSSAVSFAEPALAAFPESKMNAFYEDQPKLEDYRLAIDRIRLGKDHVLSHETEAVLAAAGPVLGAPNEIFSVLDNADQKFPTICDAAGKEVEITHANYGELLKSQDRRVRKDTFEQYYTVYDQYQHTYASTLGLQVKSHNWSAKIRGFKTARESALFYNEVPEIVYDQLVETVNKNLDLLHRYVTLRKKLLGLEEMHCWDLYVPTEKEIDLKFSFAEARETVLHAVAPLGEDYQKIFKKAFEQHWIDYAVNKGKRSGAYSSGCYDSYPYILTSFMGSLSDVYTLIHELGHSCHTYLSNKHQPFTYSGYPIFLAEIASTTNENLLTHYLLEKIDDPATRRYIVMNYLDGFKGTIFRQTQFAEFEHLIHKSDQKGIPLTSDWMNEKYGELNARYYGKDLAQDPEISLEWARIPHFYYNYYVYQYATGFSAATAFAKKIIAGNQDDIQAYLTFLSSGCSDRPIKILQKAGVDMMTAKPIEDAMDRFEHYLTVMEKEL